MGVYHSASELQRAGGLSRSTALLYVMKSLNFMDVPFFCALKPLQIKCDNVSVYVTIKMS